jgi:transposase
MLQNVAYDRIAVYIVPKREGDVELEKLSRNSNSWQFFHQTREVLALGDGLHEQGGTVVAMESTSMYWKPIFNLLEGQLNILLVNPAHIK